MARPVLTVRTRCATAGTGQLFGMLGLGRVVPGSDPSLSITSDAVSGADLGCIGGRDFGGGLLYKVKSVEAKVASTPWVLRAPHATRGADTAFAATRSR
eukprot:460408-Rhodomonas_salina.4